MNNILICTAATTFLILTSHGLAFALDKNEDSKNFIGSLNNVKFEFPHNYVRNVEYNGDPGWGYGKKGERVRSWDSNFRSLGFGISHPNFTLLKNSESLNSIIRVTLTAGEYYGDGHFLKRSFQEINRDPNYYYREVDSIYELRHFSLTIDSSVVKKSLMRDFDIYVKNDKDGKVSALIRCGNSRGDQAICTHFFEIEQFQSRITLNYKKEFLRSWNLIQSSTISRLQELRK